MSETSPELYLGCQMMTPVYEVVGGGQSCQMQHWDRVKPVLLLHECRLPEGGHSGHEGGLSQCCAVGDKLIEKTSYRLWAFRWSTSCTHTIRSTSFDRKDRFETGRKFFKISQSSMAFFRSGRMKALFNSGEKSANLSEVLTMSVSTGVSSSRQSLRMDVGIESRAHDLLGEDVMIFRTSSWCTMRNFSSGTPSKSLATFVV